MASYTIALTHYMHNRSLRTCLWNVSVQLHYSYINRVLPAQVCCCVIWKPGLQEQKESLPFSTQWASSAQTLRFWWHSFRPESVQRQRARTYAWVCAKISVTFTLWHTDKLTFLVAVDLIRAVVLTVIEEIAAEVCTYTPAVTAHKVVLSTGRKGWSFWVETENILKNVF